MLEMAKRLFPSARKNGLNQIKFDSTQRIVGDLNWFLLRFPLEVSCPRILSDKRQGAIEHARRRNNNAVLKPICPPAEFLGTLFPYQAEGAAFLIANERCILADGTGLGKTFTALGAAARAGKYPILIVCQTQIRKQWQRVIGQLFDLPSKYQISLYDKPWDVYTKRGEALAPILRGMTPYQIPKTPFTIITYNLLSRWDESLRKHGYKTIIFDEIQEMRRTGSYKYSAASRISSEAEMAWGLSGTPIYGYGIEIWNVMNILEFYCLGSEGGFSREWCTGYGSKVIAEPDVLGDYMRREGLLLRRRQSEVQSELPPVNRRIADVAHDQEVYERLVEKAVDLSFSFNQLAYHAKGRAAREIDRLTRQAAGIAKAPYVGAMIATLIEAGEKPLIFAWHHAVHDTLQEILKPYNPAVLTGRQTEQQKDEALKNFMNGDVPAAILSLRTAAGLDGLQKQATMVIFAELDWAPAVHTQCEARVARIGVRSDLNSIDSLYCVSKTGYDQVMLDVLGLKTQQFVGLMGDEVESAEDKRAQAEAVATRIKTLIEKLSGQEAEIHNGDPNIVEGVMYQRDEED